MRLTLVLLLLACVVTVVFGRRKPTTLSPDEPEGKADDSFEEPDPDTTPIDGM